MQGAKMRTIPRGCLFTVASFVLVSLLASVMSAGFERFRTILGCIVACLVAYWGWVLYPRAVREWNRVQRLRRPCPGNYDWSVQDMPSLWSENVYVKTGERVTWPAMCPCCGGPAEREIGIGSKDSRRLVSHGLFEPTVYETERASISKVPYCSVCIDHMGWNSEVNSWVLSGCSLGCLPMLVALALVTLGLLGAGWLTSNALEADTLRDYIILGFVALAIASKVYCAWREKYLFRKHALKEDCCTTGCAVAVSPPSTGTVAITFRSERYCAAFIRANGK